MSKKKNKNTSVKAVIIKGFIIGMMTFLICTAVLSAVLVLTDVAPLYYFVFYLLSVFAACFAAAYATVKKLKQKPIAVGLSAGGVISLTCFLISFTASGFSFTPYLLLTIPVGLIGAVIGTVIRSNLK